MVNLVVADDEERVCKLVVALGEWEKHGIQVVGTAANGMEALDLINKGDVDILITDIRMPGLNGQELIEKVRTISPDIKIMIISGYAYFEYAQTALKQGVSDYLLKPINKEALNVALAKMVAEIQTAKRADQELRSIQNEYKEKRKRLRSLIFRDLLQVSDLNLTEMELKERYCLDVQPGFFQILAIKQDAEAAEEQKNSVAVIWNKLEEILQREIEKECFEFETSSDGAYWYGFLNYSVRNSEKVRKVLRSCFNQMLARKDYLGKIRLSMGIGIPVKVVADIPKSFLTAERALADRLMEGCDRILETVEDKGVLYEKKLEDRFARNLAAALQRLDVEEIRTIVDNLYKETMETPGVHGWEVQELVRQCGSMFIMRLDIPDKADLQHEFLKHCENCTNVDELFQHLLEFMLKKVNQRIDLREEDAVRPVRLAKQYIHNHYQEQITLDEVSEYVGLTSAYFSVMFKKETEIGFAKYLMNERIESAKELLRDTTLSVSEICRKVGYNDQKHFTRLFEKNVGVKPAVYRKLYG